MVVDRLIKTITAKFAGTCCRTGVADANRYQAYKAMYGEELAYQWAAEDEFNRFWKYGEDY